MYPKEALTQSFMVDAVHFKPYVGILTRYWFDPLVPFYVRTYLELVFT